MTDSVPSKNQLQRWHIMSGPDGFRSCVVAGGEALERAYLDMIFGDAPPDWYSENEAEVDPYLRELRDPDEWTHADGVGPVAFHKSFEDGWIAITRLLDDVPASEPTTALEPAPTYAVCPFTRRPFFMWLEHPELGRVPTYGGPFDSYTIPTPDEDGEGTLRCERYDHDAGDWVEGGEPLRLNVIRNDEFVKLHDELHNAHLAYASLQALYNERPAPPPKVSLEQAVAEYREARREFDLGIDPAIPGSDRTGYALIPKFATGKTVKIGERGADLEVLHVYVAYNLGIAGRVLVEGVNETKLWPVTDRCRSALGHQGETLWETQCTLAEGHCGPHHYASDPRAGQTKCAVPPKGWRCTREAGHEGPCAAVPE